MHNTAKHLIECPVCNYYHTSWFYCENYQLLSANVGYKIVKDIYVLPGTFTPHWETLALPIMFGEIASNLLKGQSIRHHDKNHDVCMYDFQCTFCYLIALYNSGFTGGIFLLH